MCVSVRVPERASICACEKPRGSVVNSAVTDRLHYIADRRNQQKETDEACAFEPHRLHTGNSITKTNTVLLESYHLYPSFSSGDNKVKASQMSRGKKLSKQRITGNEELKGDAVIKSKFIELK